MKRIGVIEENERMKPVPCSTGMPTNRNNKADQAPTPGSAFQRLCTPARAGQAAVAAGGRRGAGLYLPVNSEDASAIPATEAPVGGDAPVRAACISLLISGTRRSGLRPKPPGDDGREPGGLYFPVNSQDNTAGAAMVRGRLQIVADSGGCAGCPNRISIAKACRSLLRRTLLAVGESSGTRFRLLRETAAVAQLYCSAQVYAAAPTKRASINPRLA
jgi:hypothetical protein